MDYDRIMVLDKGMIAEMDTPNKLLDDNDSIFYFLGKNHWIEILNKNQGYQSNWLDRIFIETVNLRMFNWLLPILCIFDSW